MKTKKFDEIVEGAPTVLLCPSAILNSLGRDGEGPVYTHQKEFIPIVINSMREGNGIYTTKFVVDNALKNTRYLEYIKSVNASELDKENYVLLENLVSEMESNDLILDFNVSNEKVGFSGHYDIFYKLAYKSLSDIWAEKQKKKKVEAFRVIKEGRESSGLISYLSDHYLMHMKSDFIATSLVLGSGNNLSVLSNDLNGVLRTYQDNIGGTPDVNSGKFKFFTRRSSEEFDRMVI